jgi:hypothetical protein
MSGSRRLRLDAGSSSGVDFRCAFLVWPEDRWPGSSPSAYYQVPRTGRPRPARREQCARSETSRNGALAVRF